MLVRFGNSEAVEAFRDPASDDPDRVLYRRLRGDLVTQCKIPPGVDEDEAFVTVLGAVRHHMVAGSAPAWIEAEDGALGRRLAQHFGVSDKRPVGWGGPGAVGAAMSTLLLPAVAAGLLALRWLPMLRTRAGRDWQAAIMGDPASTGTGIYAPGSWIGLTTDSTPPDSTRIALPGEITAGTLARAAGTYAHTAGTATYTSTKTYISDTNYRDNPIKKYGVFYGAVGGPLLFENLLNEPAPVVSGDQLQVTVTVTP